VPAGQRVVIVVIHVSLWLLRSLSSSTILLAALIAVIVICPCSSTGCPGTLSPLPVVVVVALQHAGILGWGSLPVVVVVVVVVVMSQRAGAGSLLSHQ